MISIHQHKNFLKIYEVSLFRAEKTENKIRIDEL